MHVYGECANEKTLMMLDVFVSRMLVVIRQYVWNGAHPHRNGEFQIVNAVAAFIGVIGGTVRLRSNGAERC